MGRNGERFLERTRHEFLEDLMDSFGDKADAFTEDLKVLLFELWVRARSRAPFPEHRPEPTNKMKQEEFEGRLDHALGLILNSPGPLRAQFVRALQHSITTGAGITRFDNAGSLNLTLDPTVHEFDQEQFAKMLNDVLELKGGGLEKFHDLVLHQVELEMKNGGAQIPELEAGLSFDDDQPRLATRLEKLGVLPPSNWVPVFQHLETGVTAGIDVPAQEQVHQRDVDTLLVYDGMNWMFPNPKPSQNGDNSHITIYVDGIEELLAGATWQDSTDNDRGTQVIDSVWLPTATVGTPTVRAVYSVVTKEYGV